MLTLNGKMTANGLGELRREMDEARRRRRAVVLDMGEVTLLDRFSAEYLNSVAGPLVHFINCPVYLRPWLSVRGR
jgi:anti-anti-sigma regulatory factor